MLLTPACLFIPTLGKIQLRGEKFHGEDNKIMVRIVSDTTKVG